MDREILEIVAGFNKLMRKAVEGPNCTDPRICKADCCHIKIDLPSTLVNFYIKEYGASENYFDRGTEFAFEIAVNPSDSKCVFYDPTINGCALHVGGYKPPQCWIYPTGFGEGTDPHEPKYAPDGTIMCKRASGWRIVDKDAASRAYGLFKKYVALCKEDFGKETSISAVLRRLDRIGEKFINRKASEIAGVKDGYDSFDILYAEGISLALPGILKKELADLPQKEYPNGRTEIIIDEKTAEFIGNYLKRTVKGFMEKFGYRPVFLFSTLKMFDKAGVGSHGPERESENE